MDDHDEKEDVGKLKAFLYSPGVQFVLQRLELIAFVINLFLVALFLAVVCYGLAIQLLHLPEVLQPLYIMAPVALVLFCFLHSLFALGWHLGIFYFLLVIFGSYLAEEFGVASGILFGAYSYSDFAPAHVSYVPLEVPFSWYVILYIAMCVSDIIVNGMPHHRRYQPTLERKETMFKAFLLLIITSVVVVAWDMALDPLGSTRCSVWIYDSEDGFYFGVPALNFFGWLVTSGFLTGAYLLVEYFFPPRFRSDPIRPYHGVLPLFVSAGFVALYAVISQPEELAMVSLASVGLPFLASVLRFVQEALFRFWKTRQHIQVEEGDLDIYEQF
mmetsp:Transcript_11240/g.45714  ORF Transcript_11240/g.45714 Transcript_11240/m.45714 type:complete len:329 (+) Transcript_11240:84-1070(+)